MSNFLFLFRGGDENMRSLSQEEKETHMILWQKWMGKLIQEKHLIDGLPLDSKGKVIANQGDVITDGPFAEGAEMIGGYLIVSAKDLSEATEISKDCPIFDYDGSTVEIREIMSMDM
ncbi:YciI family protein [Pseudotenacibaculum sp. MALMAid0570]|uniref:YciI family protein n=1 Tax=Pseudotenacibaculum sp. MALMAid0570 TaxID=3143938 RepID=UPI0032DFD04F